VSHLLKPYDAQQCYPISNRLDHVANDDEECSCRAEVAEIQSGLFPLIAWQDVVI
jgi:hypothetical protein